MFLLGTPLAVPIAVLTFFCGYIPYFGGIVATVIIIVVTYAAQGTGAVVAMIVLIAIRNAILGYGVRPQVYGRTVSLHPALVLVALPAGFELAGVVGLFAAVPVMAIVFAVANASVAILDPGPQPEAQPRPGLAGQGWRSSAGGPSSRWRSAGSWSDLRRDAAGADPVLLATILA
jgi:predicted PurR-regulated permease PerM